MRVGIDFDNTIAEYSSLFKKVAVANKLISKDFSIDKKKIKNSIINNFGEKKWMLIQGKVYGKYMPQAELMSGVLNFLYGCKLRNVELFIVSHKTIYGHYDNEKFLLRNQALKWMKSKKFFSKKFLDLDKDNIFFCNTLEDKVEKIKELNCNFFIDDLINVLTHINFPKKITKILLNSNQEIIKSKKIKVFRTWDEIFLSFFDKIQKKDIKIWAEKVNIKNIEKIEKITVDGNSQIYKITNKNKKKIILKYYPNKIIDRRPRLLNEYKAINFLQKNKVHNIPKALAINEDLNIGFYSYIRGAYVKKPITTDLESIINFIRILKKISNKANKAIFSNASEACLNFSDLSSQIENRFFILKKQKNTKELNIFLYNLEAIWKTLKKDCASKWPKESLINDIGENKQILSPSDISFKNVLKFNKKISFIDFEYFGWDDPVKVASDFIWHPSMNLSDTLIELWKNQMVLLFGDDINFSKRFKSSIPIYGIRWILIILNIYLPYNIIKKINIYNNDDFNILEHQYIQLNKAKKIYNIIKKQFIN